MKNSREVLTVMTKPIIEIKAYSFFIFLRDIKNLLKSLKRHNKKINTGHPAVTRSLLAGLQELKILVRLNPHKLSKITSVCHVLSDPEALSQAVELKKRGVIKFLIAGPNVITLPSEHGGIISRPEVDLCIVPSDWIKKKYLMVEPSLFGRIEVWPSGVDLNSWGKNKHYSPDGNLTSVLVYVKSFDNAVLLNDCISYIRALGINVTKMIYGNYEISEYRSALQHCELAIFFGSTESQGIALLESWASDVPTLVFKKSNWEYKGENFCASSAPYLNDSTGHFFETYDEFICYFDNWRKISKDYQPRYWVEKNLTDKESAKKLIKLMRKITNNTRLI